MRKISQDAAYQSRTGHLTLLWFLPKLPQGLITTNNNNKFYYPPILLSVIASVLCADG